MTSVPLAFIASTVNTASRTWQRLFAIFLILGVLQGCRDNLQQAAELATAAEMQFAANDLKKAAANIRQAIAIRDDVAAYYILLGNIEMQMGNLNGAFNAYSLALDLEGDNIDTLQNVANIGLQIGKLKEARTAADRILLLSPASSQALLIKGFLEIEEGRFDEAKATVAKILSLNPEDEGGVILAARIDSLQRQPEQGLAKIEKFVAATGETTGTSITRLEIYRMLGDAAKMRAVFPKVLEGMQDKFEYKLDYINLLYRMKDFQTARQESLAIINNVNVDQSQLGPLIKIWIEHDATPLSPAQVQSIGTLGKRAISLFLSRFFLAVGNLEHAQLAIAKLTEQEAPEALALSARIALARGEKKAAYAMANRILKIDARNEDALLVKSAENLANGQLDRAIENANIAVSDAPENIMGYAILAEAHNAKGNPIRARQIFEQGMDIMPQNMALAAQYKKMLTIWGDTSRIVSLDRDVALANPSSIAAWSVYAQSCSIYGDSQCATMASNGLTKAKTRFMIDDPPGTPSRKGLFSRITPKEICAVAGGLCTDR
jgi:tetratricopeptide (TPR) repeat protein